MSVITFVFLATTLTYQIHALQQYIGVNIDPTNTHGGYPSPQQLLALNNNKSGLWVRIEFKDASNGSSILPSTFQLYDVALANYKRAGLKILLILDYMTYQQVPWHQPASQWNQYIRTFALKVHTIALRYGVHGLVDAFEIWNEPDLKQTYVPPQAMGPLLAAAYSAIRTLVNRHVPVVLGGLASGDPSYVSQVRSATPGGRLLCDAVGLHPYGQRPEPNWPTPTWGFGFIGNLLQNYYRVSRLPIFITEVGTNDLSVQGPFPGRVFNAVRAYPFVMGTLWFCWSDAMVSPFGLVDASGNPKASYYDFVNYTKYH